MALDMPAALRPACSSSHPHGPGLCLGSTPHVLLVRLAPMVNANVMTVFDLPVTRKTAAAILNDTSLRLRPRLLLVLRTYRTS